MGNLKLSKEHGVNPTLSICLVCEKETGEIALLGDSYKGEAPKCMVTSVEPCKDCRATYLKKGTMLVGAEEDKKGKPVPTGYFTILKDSAFERIFQQKPPKGKVIFIAQAILDKFEENTVKTK